ncbi:DNA breaking-rejoining protein [Sphingomonas changnyeongensis]|uniref:DNA breaking-rejoining protein n=1 Tax=Sphingomonas changnyeongensis TaxID=2698679 RepID=A0A7Z2NVI7_9SPHN|nr:DNA breaking-rejoining protein [Sphingomonas changnyeongensis]QHL90502.1 DNA breaking-rejoining protein [Sphingomonas changnyeongensis]
MRHLFHLAAAVAVTLPFAAIAPAQPARPERVQFARGASSAAIKGMLKGDQSRTFLVNLRAGQTVTVRLQSANASANFNVTAPGAAEAMFIGSVSGTDFTAVVPSSGDYRIDLFLMRSAARRNEATSFTITIGARG